MSDPLDLYTCYEMRWTDDFAGYCVETVLVDNETGLVIAHFRAWSNPAVVDDWDPTEAGYVGIEWVYRRDGTGRPRGWRKCAPTWHKRRIEWALDTLCELWWAGDEEEL